MNSLVGNFENLEGLKEFVEECISENFKPTLAVIFASENIIISEVQKIFNSYSIKLFGASSSEEITNSKINSGSLSCMLIDLPTNTFDIVFFKGTKSFNLGETISNKARSIFQNPHLILNIGGMGINIVGEELLEGIFSESKDILVFGGMASASKLNGAFVFSEKEFDNNGLLALVLDGDRLDVKGITISGWEEIGTPKVITKSLGNYVYEIDNEPILDVYRKYLKIVGTYDELMMASEYPISLHRKNGQRAIRTAVSIDDNEKAISYGGMIPEGSEIRFCSTNISKTIDNTIHELLKFREFENAYNPDLLFLYDCAIRSRSLGPHMKKEVQLIKELWDAPLVGFSSWGEIGGGPGKVCDFHNTAIALVLITNKNKPKMEYKKKELSEIQIQEILESKEKLPNNISELHQKIEKLQREKAILSNFLHLTSGDLDKALIDIKREREKSENLLLNILPFRIAERLKSGEKTIADSVDSASILFADIVGFTPLSSTVSPADLVSILNDLFTEMDSISGEEGVEKIKTIGDAYMVVSGLSENFENTALPLFKAAIKYLDFIKKYSLEKKLDLNFRIGIHTGPVVAGVIGTKKISYDLWGDAVNTASRMESTGIPGKIHISENTFFQLKDNFQFESRGEISVKGKGNMRTYLY